MQTKCRPKIDGSRLLAGGGEILYDDDHHLSEAGAQRVKPRFRAAIAEHLAIEQPAE